MRAGVAQAGAHVSAPPHVSASITLGSGCHHPHAQQPSGAAGTHDVPAGGATRHIVVAVDSSANSVAALRWALHEL
jgi:hypothetical protein